MEAVYASGAAKEWTKLRLPEKGKGEGRGRDLERAGNSHALYAAIGNCRVVEIACERRSRPDNQRRERRRKNMRCTCLYLFCIISAALPRIPAEAGRFYSRTYSSHRSPLFPSLSLSLSYSTPSLRLAAKQFLIIR